jgi:hypothetical protein
VSARRRRAVAVVVAGCLLLASGCVGLPESGPVVTTDAGAVGSEVEALNFDPAPPQPGDDPEDIVEGFLVAMTAAPLQTSVAQRYLTSSAQGDWQPTETITYSRATVRTEDDAVAVDLDDAMLVDERGSWRGPAGESASAVTFDVVETEDDQWRIARAPDLLIVPDYFFEQRFRQVDVHWFDPSGAILVPEPVYVPEGETLPTALMRSLLLGPGPGLSGVARTYLPDGLTAPSVPVTADGLADVRLDGELPQLSQDQLDRLLAQIGWTLGQVPGLTRFRLTVGDTQVGLPGGVVEFAIETGSEFDPVGSPVDHRLYALRTEKRGLVAGGPDRLTEVGRAAGDAASGWRTIAVEPDGDRVAGVADDGESLEVGPLDDAGGVVEIASGATSLSTPTWDAVGHLWVVDRTRRGAVVIEAGGRRPRSLEVPGLTGRTVGSVVVSRDGSRLAAVVRGNGGDRLVLSRVVRDDRGRVVRLTRAQEVSLGPAPPDEIRDVGWRSPTGISVLYGTSPGVSQIVTVSVDGAERVTEATIPIDVDRLVSSPDPVDPVYVTSPDGAVSLADPGVRLATDDVDWGTLGYVG